MNEEMKYTTSCNEKGFYVCESGIVVNGPYDAEHKAKRRIRDLKAKEINAGVHGNLNVPDPAIATDDDYEAYAKAKKVTIPIRRVGCYPAIPKSAYRKDWR